MKKKVALVLTMILVVAAAFAAGHIHGTNHSSARQPQTSDIIIHAPSNQNQPNQPQQATPATVETILIPATSRQENAKPNDTESDTIPEVAALLKRLERIPATKAAEYANIFLALLDDSNDYSSFRKTPYLETLKLCFSGEIQLDKNGRPYYLGKSYTYGEEGVIQKYYLSSQPAQPIEIRQHADSTEYIIDWTKEETKVHTDHNGLKYALIPERYVAKEGDDIISIIDNQRWCSDHYGDPEVELTWYSKYFRAGEINPKSQIDWVDKYFEKFGVDPLNPQPGQAIPGPSRRVYLIDGTRNLIRAD